MRVEKATARFGLIGIATAILSVSAFVALGAAIASAPPPEFPSQVELFIVLGRTNIWMGDRIRYTLPETARVEARISGMGGELITLLRIGEQQPGQYTVPWDGTFHGAPFAGRYEFELFFGYEYAARFWFLCRPKETTP